MKKFLCILICSALFLSLCGCSVGMSSYFYDDPGKYSTGEATIGDKVNRVDIDWVSGSVEFRYHDDDSVSVTEQANRELSDTESVRYLMEEGTLYIRFAAAGSGNFNRLTKDLTVLIPRGSQIDMNLNSIAADVISEEIEYGSAEIETVSGKVSISGNGDDFAIETVSGDITLALADYADNLDISTVSGDAEITAEVDEISVESTSGNVSMKLKDVPNELKTEAVSGNVTVTLPASPSFNAEFDSVSGKFDCGHAYSYADGVYTVGDGKGVFRFDSVSGNVKIK